MSRISRSSLMAVWCFGLVIILWSTADAMSTVQIVAIGIIGVALATVPFVLVRSPTQTMTEAIRDVQTGRDR